MSSVRPVIALGALTDFISREKFKAPGAVVHALALNAHIGQRAATRHAGQAAARARMLGCASVEAYETAVADLAAAVTRGAVEDELTADRFAQQVEAATVARIRAAGDDLVAALRKHLTPAFTAVVAAAPLLRASEDHRHMTA